MSIADEFVKLDALLVARLMLAERRAMTPHVFIGTRDCEEK
jgi:hypothetical protein